MCWWSAWLPSRRGCWQLCREQSVSCLPRAVAHLSFYYHIVQFYDMSNFTEIWPPEFSLDQEKILSLLTGDRFYSNPSAALREAVLNAIDAVQRRRGITPDFAPEIQVTFSHDDLTLTVADNGIGMSQADVTDLFAKVGASAATNEANKKSVGEFGIGVISYFMAGNLFTLQTYDGTTASIGLSFDRQMLSGGTATEISSTKQSQGTTITIHIQEIDIFELLLNSFSHWCRDVEGLSAQLLPDKRPLMQKGAHELDEIATVELPKWVERAHLGPVSDPIGWDSMTGISTVAVLYRGVFVQEFEVKGTWGIEGSIDVDPKHFKPRLNREGFLEGQFQDEVTNFLKICHPVVLEVMAERLTTAVAKGTLGKWTQKRWANLWLSLPRDVAYARAMQAWDSVFRTLPAFELAVGNQWKPTSFDTIRELQTEVFVAPLADEQTNDVVQASLRFLRNTGRTVIRGIRRDHKWMRYAGSSFATTADLISEVFATELPTLVPIAARAEQILAGIDRLAPLFTGPPAVDLVQIGHDSPPVLRLHDRLIINVDNDAGRALIEDALRVNAGPMSLVESAARHTYEQLTQVAAAVRGISAEPEILGPIRRQFIRSLLT